MSPEAQARRDIAAPVIAWMRSEGIYAPDGYKVDLKATDVQRTWGRHGWTKSNTRIEWVAVEISQAA